MPRYLPGSEADFLRLLHEPQDPECLPEHLQAHRRPSSFDEVGGAYPYYRNILRESPGKAAYSVLSSHREATQTAPAAHTPPGACVLYVHKWTSLQDPVPAPAVSRQARTEAWGMGLCTSPPPSAEGQLPKPGTRKDICKPRWSVCDFLLLLSHRPVPPRAQACLLH